MYKDKTIDEILELVSGPAYNNYLLSHNNIDPISQENIWTIENNNKKISNDIPQKLLFSYTDSNNFIQSYFHAFFFV